MTIPTYDCTDLDPRQLEALVSAGFKVAVLPKQQYAVVSSFPLKTSLSLYVAIFRVYPRLRNYIAQMGLCAYPAIEICNATKMDFMMPLSRQEEFFVPEFSEEQASAPFTFPFFRKAKRALFGFPSGFLTYWKSKKSSSNTSSTIPLLIFETYYHKLRK